MTLRATIAATLVGLSMSAHAIADSPKTVDIPAGDLRQALLTLSKQLGADLVFSPEQIQGIQTRGAHGELTTQQAVTKLLEGTPLELRTDPSGAMLIASPPVAPKTSSLSEAGGERPTATAEEKKSFWSRLRLAQAASPADANRDVDSQSVGAANAEDNDSNARSQKKTGLQEVLVTGSRLKRAESQTAGVSVYSREMIARSGQTTLSDFLGTLPAVSAGTPENGPVFAGQTSVRLRGLPLGTTLVLLNGRRVESGAATFGYGAYFDLNNIPAAAIERIEIVPEGSSAIYGSDAMAGVVNIVLKNDTNGLHMGAHYGAASGIDESGGDFAWGAQNGKGSLSLLGSYFTRGSLTASEREITSSNAYGAKVSYCNPGNVSSTTGANLPGLSAATAAVNPGVHANPALSDFTAGASNTCRRIYSSLIPPSDRYSALASANYQFDSGIELFSELMYSHQDQDTELVPRNLSSTLVPASNAYNPFGTDVRVSYLFDSPAAMIAYDNSAHFSRALLGARGNLPKQWGWELAAWDVRDSTRIKQNATLVDSANLAAALASSDPDTALNVFTGGPSGSEALLESIYGIDMLHASSSSQVVSGFFRGPTVALPAGAIELVLGAEFSHSKVDITTTSGSYDVSSGRDVSSLFSELRVPLLRSLSVGGAVRYDHYDTFGGHVTPQYSVEWRPAKTLFVRGAYAKAFKAPILYALSYPLYTYPDLCCVSDPQHGGQSVSYTFLREGNADLGPESADSKSVAVTWTPDALPGFESSLNGWQIEQRDRVTTLQPQTVVDNESLFPGRVVRDPVTGAIQSVHVGYLNFGELRVSGSDLSLRYRLGTGLGYLSPSLSVTRIYKYEAVVAPGAPVENRLNVATNTDAWAPKWKGLLGLGWDLGPYSANVTGRYVSSYHDYAGAAAATHPLGDFWLWDLSLKYRLDGVLAAHDSRLRDAFVQLSAVNLFNSLPVYSSGNGGTKGYDATQYDIRGRFVAVNVGVRF